MRTIKVIMGNQVVDIITKYFFIDDILHFRIILDLKSKADGRIVYGNFDDYTDYKQSFRKIQAARKGKVELTIPSLSSYRNTPPAQQRAN